MESMISYESRWKWILFEAVWVMMLAGVIHVRKSQPLNLPMICPVLPKPLPSDVAVHWLNCQNCSKIGEYPIPAAKVTKTNLKMSQQQKRKGGELWRI